MSEAGKFATAYADHQRQAEDALYQGNWEAATIHATLAQAAATRLLAEVSHA